MTALQQGPQTALDVVGTHPGDQREPPGDAGRVEELADLDDVLAGHGGPDLAPDRVADPAKELHVGAVELAGAFADPDHVGRAVVPGAGGGVAARERLFVGEQQRLVAGVDVDFAEAGVGLGVHTGRPHEPERTIDLAGQLLVPLAGGAAGDELLVPGVDAVERCEPALGERPDEVQGGCRLVVRLNEPFRCWYAGSGGGALGVDDVAAERRDVVVADPFVVG